MNRPADARRVAPAMPLLRRLAAFAAALMLFAAGSVAPAGAAGTALQTDASKPFTTCDNQTYALCATAKCTMFNGISYCKCDVEKGDSISLTQDYKKGDVCSFNARGADNGYMVSTFSTPESVVKPKGDQAIYNCSKSTSTGAYAQCDGGVCFKSSQGQHFPGFSGALAKDEIICACPAVVADPETAEIGFQIVGPYPCDQNFFKYCNAPTATTDNGSSLYVGAPTGSARFLSEQLTGKKLPFNQCGYKGG